MSGNDVWRQTAEKAKIIYPPPPGVDINTQNSFQVTTDLLNSENLKVAIA